MASSNVGSLSPPIFNGENYQIWAVRMKALLKGLDLWEAVEMGADPPPLRANPTVTQLKHYAEESAKKFKALSYIHSAVSESIFTRIMACETGKEAWDRLREEFQGSENTRQMQFGRPGHGDPREFYNGQPVLVDRVSQQLSRDHVKLKPSLDPNPSSPMLGRTNGI
ncbi:hypothetical protein GH714_010353 [Hevea brasiliensis]|uniref:Uncharacterized protein n=1 Tax=Hevea brasiliensis TaxID=3981 RepID=A0A6A6MLU0_HEVBR|nr:hypothetical protein GH714_010353 [Hevea brasiliensis]